MNSVPRRCAFQAHKRKPGRGRVLRHARHMVPFAFKVRCCFAGRFCSAGDARASVGGCGSSGFLLTLSVCGFGGCCGGSFSRDTGGRHVVAAARADGVALFEVQGDVDVKARTCC